MAGPSRVVTASPRLFGLPCWHIPILAGTAWLLTLMSLLFTWISKGSPHYMEMQANQSIAYISDTGTSNWGKPLFIAGSTVTVVLFGTAFAVERWLRHKGRLIHVSSAWSMAFSALALLFTVQGSMGLILLSIFDARRHPAIHFPMIGVFVVGYLLAAGFMAAEKKRISNHYPENLYVRRSFQIKLFFIVLELAFVLLFVLWALMAGQNKNGPHADLRNPSVVAEWIVGFFFVFYIWSFAIDFLPVPELVGDDGDRVELLCDPATLWDGNSGNLHRPSIAWSRKSMAGTTRLVRVEEFRFDEKGMDRLVCTEC